MDTNFNNIAEESALQQDPEQFAGEQAETAPLEAAAPAEEALVMVPSEAQEQAPAAEECPAAEPPAEEEVPPEPAVIETEPDLSGDPEPVPTPSGEEPGEPEIPVLPLPDPISDFKGGISAFGFSQQGESHLNKSVPCQDRSSLRFLSDTVLAAAVSDGVGSCALSDYGSATAVEASLDYLQANLGPNLEDPEFTMDVKFMGSLLRGMMKHAYDRVKEKAEEMEQLLYSMQSTLTVAVYDGKKLYFAHAGDDGIVALTRQGKCEMVTSRHKGEEASSVYPLQSCNTWQYGLVDDVVGFVMATDGVLDAFVRNETEENRVYYPFVEPVFSTPLANAEETAAACADWYAYMQTPGYRAMVTDDLSFVCVVNQEAIKDSVKPDFDLENWKKKTQEYEARRRAALYPPKSQEKDVSNKTPSGAENQNPSPSPAPGNRASGTAQHTAPGGQAWNAARQAGSQPQNRPGPADGQTQYSQWNPYTPPKAAQPPHGSRRDNEGRFDDLRENIRKAQEGFGKAAEGFGRAAEGIGKAAAGFGGSVVIVGKFALEVTGDVAQLVKERVDDIKENCGGPQNPGKPNPPRGRRGRGDGGRSGGN